MFKTILTAAALIGFAASAHAAAVEPSYTYDVNQSLPCAGCGVIDGPFFGPEVSTVIGGTITTDALGVFTDPSAFVAWSISVGLDNDQVGPFAFTEGNSFWSFADAAEVEATPTQLIFSGPVGASFSLASIDGLEWTFTRGSITQTVSAAGPNGGFINAGATDPNATSAVVGARMSAVPLPLTLPLLAAAIGALATLAGRRKAA